ncbi:MAG: hypothetical protein QOC98_25, partial [Frankiaceae bacterium]|nr:hypothetical protein [Frankiaceae bacterium]
MTVPPGGGPRTGPGTRPGTGPGTDAPLDRQPAPALSRAAVDRSADHRTDREWLADAWSTRGQVLLLDAE